MATELTTATGDAPTLALAVTRHVASTVVTKTTPSSPPLPEHSGTNGSDCQPFWGLVFFQAGLDPGVGGEVCTRGCGVHPWFVPLVVGAVSTTISTAGGAHTE